MALNPPCSPPLLGGTARLASVAQRAERKLAAILSMDAVGYSRLMASDEFGRDPCRVVPTGCSTLPEETAARILGPK